MSGTRISAAERRERAASENTGGTLGNLRPWVKGQPSPNPGGRPRGIAATVREKTDPGELVDVLLAVANDSRSKPAERIAAVRELLDRGYGKAPAFAAIEGENPLELSAIAAEVQAIADELAARRDAREAPEGAPAKETGTG